MSNDEDGPSKPGDRTFRRVSKLGDRRSSNDARTRDVAGGDRGRPPRVPPKPKRNPDILVWRAEKSRPAEPDAPARPSLEERTRKFRPWRGDPEAIRPRPPRDERGRAPRGERPDSRSERPSRDNRPPRDSRPDRDARPPRDARTDRAYRSDRDARPDREPRADRATRPAPRGGDTRRPAPPAAAGAPASTMRISKAMARAGLCSRRDAERWISEGRVVVNGRVLDTPALDVGPTDKVMIDGLPLPPPEPVRLWRYHKPKGLVTTHADPEGRETVFDTLPADLPRVISIGRLDYNTEGLLLLTTSGALARHLELPTTGLLRRYRVRAFGAVTQEALDALKDGIEIEGIEYGPIEATLDSVQGSNVWLTLGLREGKNREVRNILLSLGLDVNRLIRLSYGPFQLLDLAPGTVEIVRRRVLAEQLGPALAAELDLDGEADEAAMETPRRERPAPARRDDRASPAGERRPYSERPRHDRSDRDRPDRHTAGRPAHGRPSPGRTSSDRGAPERRDRQDGERPSRDRPARPFRDRSSEGTTGGERPRFSRHPRPDRDPRGPGAPREGGPRSEQASASRERARFDRPDRDRSTADRPDRRRPDRDRAERRPDRPPRRDDARPSGGGYRDRDRDQRTRDPGTRPPDGDHKPWRSREDTRAPQRDRPPGGSRDGQRDGRRDSHRDGPRDAARSGPRDERGSNRGAYQDRGDRRRDDRRSDGGGGGAGPGARPTRFKPRPYGTGGGPRPVGANDDRSASAGGPRDGGQRHPRRDDRDSARPPRRDDRGSSGAERDQRGGGGGRSDGFKPRAHRPGGPRPDGGKPRDARADGPRSGGGRPDGGARPAGARPGGSKPGGSRPGGSRPGGPRPGGSRPGKGPPRGAR